MKKIIIFTLIGLFVFSLGAKESHSLFTEILKDYVKGGLVNYEGLKTDDRLDEYLKQLDKTKPESLSSENERLALWINAYNAYTLKVISDNYPVESINDLHSGGLILGTIFGKTVWDRKFVKVGGKKYTLNQVEHKIIRPTFDEPRIHFALVCAAISCPPLRAEAFEADRIDKQLDEQAITFLNNDSLNRYDLDAKKVYISEILKWYKKDFAKNNKELISYISPFLPPAIKTSMEEDPKAWKVDHIKYDWSLNEQ